MKKLTFVLMVATLAVASSCSKEKKVAKSLWKDGGTWTVTNSSYGYYSMGTYNTSTQKYEDSLTVASGNFNDAIYVFGEYDNGALEGDGTFTTADTTINFSYSVYDKGDFGGTKGEFELSITNDTPSGGTSTQDIYDILSHDETNMTFEKKSSSGWSTTPYDVTHSYISITMVKQ
jgi:hypothetical protein